MAAASARRTFPGYPLALTLGLALPIAAAALGLDEAKSQLGREFAHCSNWYLIMRAVAERSLPPGLDRNMAIAQQQELADRAFEHSAMLTSREVALERAKVSMTELMARMSHSLENLPAIADDHAHACKSLLDSPDGRLQFWLER